MQLNASLLTKSKGTRKPPIGSNTAKTATSKQGAELLLSPVQLHPSHDHNSDRGCDDEKHDWEEMNRFCSVCG